VTKISSASDEIKKQNKNLRLQEKLTERSRWSYAATKAAYEVPQQSSHFLNPETQSC
jgi:hypothetical protein